MNVYSHLASIFLVFIVSMKIIDRHSSLHSFIIRFFISLVKNSRILIYIALLPIGTSMISFILILMLLTSASNIHVFAFSIHLMVLLKLHLLSTKMMLLRDLQSLITLLL